MKISCICLTYGRPPDHIHLIEEAVESFLRQSDEYEKELIILNDAKGQIYELSDNAYNEHIKIINEDSRYSTLGGKYNAAISMSSGDLICPWEDDDISLSWRIEMSVEKLGDYDYWNPKGYWFSHCGGLCHDHGIGISHNCSIFRRSAWEKVGGYPEVSGGQDGEMDGLLYRNTYTTFTNLSPPNEWFYIYRWGVSPNHLSGRSPHQEFYDEIGLRDKPIGTYILNPHWAQDYENMCSTYLTELY